MKKTEKNNKLDKAAAALRAELSKALVTPKGFATKAAKDIVKAITEKAVKGDISACRFVLQALRIVDADNEQVTDFELWVSDADALDEDGRKPQFVYSSRGGNAAMKN